MPIELEIKLRVAAHDPVRRRLRECGAGLLRRVVETNWILDNAEGTLRNQGCGLRVRLAVAEGGERGGTMTFKGPRASGPFKAREELEIEISDAATCVEVLSLLGYTPVLKYQKQRESWQLGECRIELDEPARLGQFVEIEGPDQQAIREAQARIGLSDAVVEHASYVELVLDWCKANDIEDRVLLLERTESQP